MSAPAGKTLGKIALPVLLIVSFAAVILLKMGFIFILVALLPSLMAYFIDREPSLPVFKTVLACNLAAILPIISPMLKAALHSDPYNVMVIMTSPVNWMIAYGGAAIGWGMIFLCRIIASFIMTIVYDYKIAALERLQKKLVEEWGKDITHKSV